MLAALDDRSFNSSLKGHLGGLLQSSSYIAGVSGGSWLIMSSIMSDFQPLVKLRHDWELFEPLLEGIPNINQMEVDRNDVQVLPADFKDDDSGFYEQLNRIGKRSVCSEDSSLFENFYRICEHAFNGEQEDSMEKRELISEKKEEDWFEGFRAFFKDLFKKKEDSTKVTANVLKNIELTPDVSLKSMKNVFNFYKNLHLEVRAKKLSGFSVSFTDYWGRALSRRIFAKTARSTNLTLSSVTEKKSFKNFEMPFPIVLSDSRNPGVERSPINSNVFEFNPFEFGSWDMKVFMNLKYLGSLLYNGKPIFHISNRTICFSKFDNAGFIAGTSSSLFNNIFIYVWQVASSSSRNNYRAIKAVLNTFGLTSLQDRKKNPDYALYSPNPFYRMNDTSLSFPEIYNSKILYMVDGGEDGQNIPYVPLLQEPRALDVIFSFDSTSDKQGWPNGTIISNTAMRFNNPRHPGTTITVGNDVRVINKFPDIPDSAIFLKENMTHKPVFFGCHLERYGIREGADINLMTANEYIPPIVGYFANTEYSYQANSSTFQLSYEYDEVSKNLQNAYNVMTYGNSTIDPGYYRCVGCILIKREFDRKERGLSILNNMELPKFCRKCFRDYCYN